MGKTTSSLVIAGVALTLFTLSFAACGSNNDKFTGKDGGSDEPDVYVMPDDAFNFPDLGVNEGSSCTVCSGDLHSVLDCNNNVITTCPPDQGCGAGGVCVPACQSAADNKSTVGCNYFAVDVAFEGEADGACFAAYVANTWTSDVTLGVNYKGKALPIANFARLPVGSGSSLTYQALPGGVLPAGKVAILFLADWKSGGPGHSDYTACPSGVTAADTADEVSSENTDILDAFNITADRPVVAYDIFPYGGSLTYISSATLLIPTSAWDTNYLTIDAYAAPSWATSTTPQQPYMQFVALQNSTTVTISPTAAIVGNGTTVAATAKGKPITYNLNAGQVLQLKQYEELNGSAVQSNNPIGVWGGHACMEVDVSDTWCDSAHQELFPIKAMGNQYVAVKYGDRSTNPETPPWRIMGVVDNTTLTYSPSKPAGAPTSLMSGQVVKFDTGTPFVVSSQDSSHPFYLGGHMTGQSTAGVDMTTGDPEWVNVVPPAQFLPRYIFMTDPTMSFTELVFVRGPDSNNNLQDVTLDCAGTLKGWTTVPGTAFQWTRVDLVKAGAGVGSCNNGFHETHSAAPFGVTVWGWDQYVSYAYPGGASVQPINNVVVIPTPH
jgi:hypothetical protein